MKFSVKLSFLLCVFILNQACNTLYNTRIIDIEILEPAGIKLPKRYENIALRYNNVNVAHNPKLASYSINKRKFPDSTNLDSLASKIYFQQFAETLQKQAFFNRITVLPATDYSKVAITDTLTMELPEMLDSTFLSDDYPGFISSLHLLNTIEAVQPAPQNVQKYRSFEPYYGLYSREMIGELADTSNADLLLSLDLFFSQNKLGYLPENDLAYELVMINYFWTAYDLQEQKLMFHISKSDTIHWTELTTSPSKAFNLVPPRKDAVLNAADIAGTNTAQFILPHWITIQRMYYFSINKDLNEATQLAEAGKWIEAAKIWKAHIESKNKKTAAKCMFNMAIACEMNDDLDAAIEWVVKSYYVFGETRPDHAANCKEYIRVLSLRKLDVKMINEQLKFDEEYF